MVRSLRSLKIFVTVAEELHFRKAAERLHMTQPPLSLQIKQLEDSIGVELFCRTTRSVQLTPAGKELHHRATRILTELDAMTEAVRSVGKGTVGSFSLGFTASTMFDLLPRLLEVQRKRYPKVALALKEQTSVELLESLRARKLDAILVRAAPLNMEPDLEYIVASQESLLLALPTDHPLARFESVPIRALNQIPFIGFSADGAPYFRELLATIFKEYDVHPEQIQESVLPTILALVEARLGVALVPESIARLRTQALTYRPLLNIRETNAVPLYYAWRKAETPPPPVENFIDIVSQCRPSAASDMASLQACNSQLTEMF
jgi:DNA-binding transcriptional LysR family regulator